MRSASQNTLLLCYLQQLHRRSNMLHKLAKKSSALQAYCCYMKRLQVCVWSLSSSLHFMWPLMMRFKSASYPAKENQRKLLNKFNIFALMLWYRVYIAKKKKELLEVIGWY